MQRLLTVKASQLRPGKYNPRLYYSLDTILDMKNQIVEAKMKIREPLSASVLLDEEGKPLLDEEGEPLYSIDDGHRRYFAGLDLGFVEFAILLDDSAKNDRAFALATDFSKEHFTEAEVGYSFGKLCEENGWSISFGARKMGKDKSWLSKCIKATKVLSQATCRLNIERQLSGATLFLLSDFAAEGLDATTIDRIAQQAGKEGLTTAKVRKLLNEAVEAVAAKTITNDETAAKTPSNGRATTRKKPVTVEKDNVTVTYFESTGMRKVAEILRSLAKDIEGSGQ